MSNICCGRIDKSMNPGKSRINTVAGHHLSSFHLSICSITASAERVPILRCSGTSKLIKRISPIVATSEASEGTSLTKTSTLCLTRSLIIKART